MIFFIWCLNLGISLWNAYATGKVWVEAKHAGGVHRFMAWMGYLMASLGFSWAILVLVGMLLQSLGTITPDQATLFLQAGYVLMSIIPLARSIISRKPLAAFSRHFRAGVGRVRRTV